MCNQNLHIQIQFFLKSVLSFKSILMKCQLGASFLTHVFIIIMIIDYDFDDIRYHIKLRNILFMENNRVGPFILDRFGQLY